MSGLNQLNQFFLSVQQDNPELAELISPDIEIVALYSLSHATTDKTPGQDAAERLRIRKQAAYYTVDQSQMLENALTDLGF
jgi:hypothetical protein